MIFKIQPPSGSDFHAIDYNEKKIDKNHAYLIHMQNFGNLQGQAEISKLQLQNYLKTISQTNKRIVNPAFHASLSCKGNEFTHDQLADFAKDIMEKLGYKNQPMLIYGHSDTNNNHVHIVTTRIDYQGKKINDKFEKKRANSYLNAIMNRHPALEFEANKNMALLYKFTTVPQFNMLMEARGYKVKSNNGVYNYYKHGSLLGKIDEQFLKQNLSLQANDKNRISQVKALIYKYQDSYSSTLKVIGIKNEKDNYHYQPKQKKFHSELTDFMKDKFGLEFMFFAAKNHDKPYGYAIIDHKDKTIYKGSDVIKLEHLMTGEKMSEAKEFVMTEREETIPQFNISAQFSQPEETFDFNNEILERELAQTIEEIASTERMSQNITSSTEDDLQKFIKRKKKR